MAKMIFVNLPVADVAISTAFYEAIGMVKNEQFSNKQGSGMSWSDTINFMLLDRAFYATFTTKQIIDAKTMSGALIALNFDDRTAVDTIVEKALAAGGRELHDPEDEGFMYSRAFEDLDGHGFGPFWMDASSIPASDGAHQPAEA